MRRGRVVTEAVRARLSLGVAQGGVDRTYRGPNHSSRPASEVLSRRIKRYWEEHGATVSCRLTRLDTLYRDMVGPHGRHRVYGVRSTLVNGLPVQRDDV